MVPITVDNNLRHDDCPLCRSAQIDSVGPLDYQGRVRFSTCEIELTRLPELWSCHSCGSSFVQNAIDEATSKSLYTAGDAADRWPTEPFQNIKTNLVIRTLQGMMNPGIRLLDVGANSGELLDFARLHHCETAGVEYSETSCKLLCEKGHAAFDSIESVLTTNSQYDLITAFDLIEHLYDVPRFLNNAYKLLSIGGKLLILTGNIQSRTARLTGTHWWYAQHPEHIVFPSVNYLANLRSYKIHSLQYTFASTRFLQLPLFGILQLLRRKITGQVYAGLPSIGSDHILITLEKTYS